MVKIVGLAESLAQLVPGERVFVPGASGAPTAWMDLLLSAPAHSNGLSIMTTYVPGINRLALDHLHSTAVVSGLFMHAELASAQRNKSYRHLPLSYGGFLRAIGEEAPFDVAVFQVAPPDGNGRCSLGPSVEFNTVIFGRARRRVGVINAATPVVRGAPSLPLSSFDTVVDCDAALAVYGASDAGRTAAAIAGHVASFITDGTTLQIGLGKVPAAVLDALGDRRGLRFHSGMLSDGFMGLHARGALRRDHDHVACTLVGSREFYDWAADCPFIQLRGCEETHAPARLAALDRLVAINSALEVDLFGQCNLEFLGGRAVSGPGGAPDFAAAAKRAQGGISIVALPASSQGASRIRACLEPGTTASLARSEVDVVVTEHGAADLRGCSVYERAEALIRIAMPGARDELAAAWRSLAARF
jgi:4-hydroxybutyrate CoA-transferase